MKTHAPSHSQPQSQSQSPANSTASRGPSPLPASGPATPGPAQVMIIDDEEAMRVSLAQWLDLSGYHPRQFSDPETALRAIDAGFDGVVLTDVKMPGMDGITLARAILAIDRDIPVIVMTGHGDVPMAVEAMKSGAYDFVEKPFEPNDIVERLERAAEKRRLVLENRQLRRQIAQKGSLDGRLIGNSRAMTALKAEIANIAPTEVPVLISGETGTGKELVARAIHDLSARKDSRFVAVNCAAIAETTAESELFGHEKGAFTGAGARRIGWIEHAHNGTLFLDEISSMPLGLQAKLLRVIEEREVVRLGSNTPVKVNFRLVCATNEDLPDAVAQRKFREDLLFRINTFDLKIAPLRQRRDDLALLFDIFAQRASDTFNRPYDRPPAALLAELAGHDWPGNVRQLRNLAERYVLLVGAPEQRWGRLFGDTGPQDTSGDTTRPTHGMGRNGTESLGEQMRRFEQNIIRDALERHDGNVKSVMEELDIPRRTLNEKMRKLDIRRDDNLSDRDD